MGTRKSRSNSNSEAADEGAVDALLERIFDCAVNERFAKNDRRFVRRACVKYRKSARILTFCAEYEQMLAVDHTHQKSMFRRSWLKAKHLYRQATRLDPKYARAWEGLASILDVNEDYARAEDAARRAVRYGDDPCSVALLARIIAQRGKAAEANRLARTIRRSSSEYSSEIARQVLGGEWKPLD